MHLSIAERLVHYRRYRINTLSLVPSAVHQLVNHPEFAETDLSSINSVGCGAAHLPTTLRDNFLSRFKNVTLWEGLSPNYHFTKDIADCAAKGMACQSW